MVFLLSLLDRREINRSLAAQLKAKLNFGDSNDVDHHSEEQQEQNEQLDSSRTTNNHHGKFCLLCVCVCSHLFLPPWTKKRTQETIISVPEKLLFDSCSSSSPSLRVD